MNKSFQFLVSVIVGTFISAGIFFLVYSALPAKSNGVAVDVPSGNKSSHEPISSVGISQLYDIIDSSELQSPTALTAQLLPSFEQMGQQALQELFEHVSSKIRNQQQQTLEQLIFRRLADVDPKAAFETIISLDYFKQEQLIPMVMSRWSRESLEDALSAAATMKGGLRLSALTSALSGLSEAAHQQALEFATDLGIESKVKQALSEIKIRSALHNPAEAFEITLTDEVPDEDQLDLFGEASELWLSSEGTKAIPQLLEILQTKEGYGRNFWPYYYELANQLAEFDPPLVWELVENDYQGLRESLRASILGRWVQIDIDGAQAALQELDQDEYVEELYRSMIQYGLSDDPLLLVQQVEKFPRGHQGHLLQEAVFVLALYGDIDAAFDVLKQMEGLEVNTNGAIELLVMGWTNHDTVAAIDWVLQNTEKGSEFQGSLLRANIGDLTEFDPDQALAVAIEYDDPRYVDSWISLPILVIRTVVRQGDIEMARRLLGQLGEPKNSLGHDQIGSKLIRTGRIDEAIDLGNELSDTLQVEYYDNIAYQWILMETEDFLDRLPTFSNELVQSAMADVVLSDNRLKRLLSDKEIAYLEEFSSTEREE